MPKGIQIAVAEEAIVYLKTKKNYKETTNEENFVESPQVRCQVLRPTIDPAQKCRSRMERTRRGTEKCTASIYKKRKRIFLNLKFKTLLEVLKSQG